MSDCSELSLRTAAMEEVKCWDGVKYKASIRSGTLLHFCFGLLSKFINVYGIKPILFYRKIKPDGRASGSEGS